MSDAEGGLGLLVTIGLLLALHNANRFSITGIFGPLRARFGGAYTGVGNLFSAYPFAYACSQIPAGYLADRVEPRRLVVLATAVAAVMAIVFAVTDVYALALVARAVAGVAGAFIYTPAISFGIAAFAPARRGAAIGVSYVGVGLGMAVSIAGMPPLVETIGLTGALLSLAAFAAVMTVVTPFGLAIRGGARAKTGTSPRRLLGDAAFRALLAFSFLGFFATYALLTWLPAYLSDALGVSATEAGALAALVNVTMTVLAPLVGTLSDRLPSRHELLELGALLSVAAFGMLLLTRSVAMAVVASILAGVASAMTTAPLFVFAGERFGEGAAGLAVGMVNGIGQTGSALSGVVFGALLDATGTFSAIWWTCLPLGLVRWWLLRAVADGAARQATRPTLGR